MEENFNRPCLGCQPCSDNLPMVLSSSPLIQVPASIAQYLKDYQREGVRFLYRRYRVGGGGILADDMGLGKTIQAIAFSAAILKMTGTTLDNFRHVTNFVRQDVAPHFIVPAFEAILIVCPASLVDNWVKEFLTWGFFKVLKFSTSNRFEIINNAKHQTCDVVIATYEGIRSNVDLFNTVQWSAIFVDEVHCIKDMNSKTAKALRSVQNKYRFGLTGTPFQNNLKELWCLLDWANPGCMDSFVKFSNKMKALEVGRRQKSSKGELVKSALARIMLSSNCYEYMLIRKKDVLAEHLPTKTDQVVFCNLTPIQEKIYLALIQSSDLQILLGQLDKKNDTNCNKSGWISPVCVPSGSKKKDGVVFTYMNLLHKTANHPALLLSSRQNASSDIAYDICSSVVGSICIHEDEDSREKLLKVLSSEEMSGKMQVLFKLIPAFLKNGDKILIFSSSTKLLDLIEKKIIQKSYRFSRLDGSTPVNSRLALVLAFNSSQHPSVFLISTKAGGVGLNVTGANVVIIYDPSWNPAQDLQAQDRAYRFGQRRDVRVYRFLSASTIEEFIYLRQLYKLQLGSASISNASVSRLFNSVSGDPRYRGELFGIRNIFSYRQNKRSLTEEILDRQGNVESALQQKLMPHESDEACGAKAMPYLLKTDDGVNVIDNSSKDGLVDFFGDITGLNNEEFESNSNSDVESNDNNDTGKTENDCVEASVSNILETTTVVRNIVNHDEIVAPSRAEELMETCAVRDVLQKHKNSQVPAFHCSLESQDISVQLDGEEQSTSSADHFGLQRMCFNALAKKEYMSPYHLGLKVLSMSTLEKLQLLNKHQKKKLSISSIEESTSCTTSLVKGNLLLDPQEPPVIPKAEMLISNLNRSGKREFLETSFSKNSECKSPQAEIPAKVLLLDKNNSVNSRNYFSYHDSLVEEDEEHVTVMDCNKTAKNQTGLSSSSVSDTNKLSIPSLDERMCCATTLVKENTSSTLQEPPVDSLLEQVLPKVEFQSPNLTKPPKREFLEMSIPNSSDSKSPKTEISSNVLLLSHNDSDNSNKTNFGNHETLVIRDENDEKHMTVMDSNKTVKKQTGFSRSLLTDTKKLSVTSSYLSKENAAILESLFFPNLARKPSPCVKYENNRDQTTILDKRGSSGSSDHRTDTLPKSKMDTSTFLPHLPSELHSVTSSGRATRDSSGLSSCSLLETVKDLNTCHKNSDENERGSRSSSLEDLMNEVFFNGTLVKSVKQRRSESTTCHTDVQSR